VLTPSRRTSGRALLCQSIRRVREGLMREWVRLLVPRGTRRGSHCGSRAAAG
jgi:hypothetical protein